MTFMSLKKLHDTLHPVVLRHVLTVEADQNVTAMRAAQIADIFEGNLSSDSKLRYQIEHFEPDSVCQSRKSEHKKHTDNFSDKSSDKNNLFPRQDRVNTQFKDSGKGETKRDLSKLPHFGQKKVFAGLVEVKAHKMDVKVHIIKGQQQ